MPFFSRYHTPTSAFPSDVFRLLDELNQVSTPTTSSDGNKRAFAPNFDIHETDSAYVLEGELPGLDDKSKLNIEFTDDKTLLIRGKIEKSVTRSSPDTEAADGEKKKDSQVAKQTDDSQKQVSKQSEGQQLRYWVSERTVGEFQRSFSFPGGIDIDNVKANLEHGLLKIVVPKKEVVKGRKVEIS
ncbi:HSP20-like chaperone [Morchella snyderi]|nr:HSP20-like chaperone [Morchella snyderi]